MLRVLAVVLLAGLTVGVGRAPARPCSYRGASAPHITRVTNNVVTIEGAGSIGGCSRAGATGVARVTLTVCLQRLTASGWRDVRCIGPVTRAWSRYTRFARQLGLTVEATCRLGRWRTIARGGDGFPPVKWVSEVVRFASTDQYACGEPGGA